MFKNRIKFPENRNLAIIALIAIVNALGYGIIIPILYSYSQKFGLFSICQFLSTPIIGRLSDKYGRKPLLLISLIGTTLSFFIAAFAPNAIFLFIGRALDGLTAGNIPVASAVISDTTDLKDRVKGFGIIGASFSFGFVFGPAIAALTLPFGMNAPFILAGVICLISVIVTAIFLPETNQHMGEITKQSLFNFNKLFKAAWDEKIGKTLIVSFLFSLVFSLFIYGFQPFSVKVIHLSVIEIAVAFTISGVIGLISQVLILPRVSKKFSETRILPIIFILAASNFLAMFFIRSLPLYYITIVAMSLTNSFVNPLIQSMLSKEADEKSQGSVMGLSASYMSIGMILGPIIGGAIATIFIPLPFLLASLVCFVCFIFAKIYIKIPVKPESVF